MERLTELKAEADWLRNERAGAPDRSTLPREEARAQAKAALPELPTDRPVAELDAGVLRIGVAGAARKIVLIHGGGFVVGDQRAMLPLALSLIDALDATVYLPRYRFAPEHDLDAITSDAIEGVLVAVNDGDVDTPVTVVGHSAGAYLAARSSFALADTAPIVSVVMLAPMLYPDMASPSIDQWATGQGLTRSEVVWFWTDTLGDPPAPLVDIDTLLPPRPPRILIVTAGCDPLRDDGARFYARLNAHGIYAQYVGLDGALHTQLNAQLPVARDVVTSLIASVVTA
ncbi:MAG: alpha/beta fold hydrolase [Nitriliruptoraceae bacterium]